MAGRADYTPARLSRIKKQGCSSRSMCPRPAPARQTPRPHVDLDGSRLVSFLFQTGDELNHWAEEEREQFLQRGWTDLGAVVSPDERH